MAPRNLWTVHCGAFDVQSGCDLSGLGVLTVWDALVCWYGDSGVYLVVGPAEEIFGLVPADAGVGD